MRESKATQFTRALLKPECDAARAALLELAEAYCAVVGGVVGGFSCSTSGGSTRVFLDVGRTSLVARGVWSPVAALEVLYTDLVARVGQELVGDVTSALRAALVSVESSRRSAVLSRDSAARRLAEAQREHAEAEKRLAVCEASLQAVQAQCDAEVEALPEARRDLAVRYIAELRKRGRDRR